MPMLKHIMKYAAPAETEKGFRKSVVPLHRRLGSSSQRR
jgi:hypothetical protein